MRFGINTFLFVSPFKTEDAKLFKKFSRWGFQTVEIPVESPQHIDPERLKSEAQKAKLEISSLLACMRPGRDLRGTDLEQKTAFIYLKTLINLAARMGCRKVVGPLYASPAKSQLTSASQQKRQFATVANHLRALAKHAQAKGVVLAIEPLNRYETDFLNTCQQGLRLLKAIGSENVYLHLNTFHMHIEEKTPHASLRKVGSRLGHFHACGTDRGTPGNDSLDWKAIASTLQTIEYQGDIVIESFNHELKPVAAQNAIWRKLAPTRNEIAVEGLANLRRAFALNPLVSTAAPPSPPHPRPRRASTNRSTASETSFVRVRS